MRKIHKRRYKHSQSYYRKKWLSNPHRKIVTDGKVYADSFFSYVIPINERRYY